MLYFHLESRANQRLQPTAFGTGKRGAFYQSRWRLKREPLGHETEMEIVGIIVAVLALVTAIFLQTLPSTIARNFKQWIHTTRSVIRRNSRKDEGSPASSKEVTPVEQSGSQSEAEQISGGPTRKREAYPSGPVMGLRQGDKCPLCSAGVVYFDQWSPGPAGSFTAYYRCSKCQAVLPSDKDFDGGLI